MSGTLFFSSSLSCFAIFVMMVCKDVNQVQYSTGSTLGSQARDVCNPDTNRNKAKKGIQLLVTWFR